MIRKEEIQCAVLQSRYEDDGYTYAYEKGQWAQTEFTYDDTAKVLTVCATEGGYTGMPWARTYEVFYHDAPKPETVLVDGTEETAWIYDAKLRLLKVTLEQRPATCAMARPFTAA